MTNKIFHISTTTMPVGTKLGRIVTYHEGFLLIKSNGFLVT